MNDYCNRCRVHLSDYEGQLDEILEEVKVEPEDMSGNKFANI